MVLLGGVCLYGADCEMQFAVVSGCGIVMKLVSGCRRG